MLSSIAITQNHAINNESKLDTVKRHHSSFGQLKLIAEQMLILKEKADKIINDSCINDNLHKRVWFQTCSRIDRFV